MSYYCPACGEELEYDDKVYRSEDGSIVGCCNCILIYDAEDAL